MKKLVSLFFVFFSLTYSVWAEAFSIEDKSVVLSAPKQFQHVADTNRSYNDGKEGFMIVTTNELTHNVEAMQRYITTKAEHRGFRVFVATENDWLGKSEAGRIAKERKAFPARVRGHDILHYLKARYQPLQLKYVLFIGDPRPEFGTIPMLGVHHHKHHKNGVDLNAEMPEDPMQRHIREHLVNDEGRYTEYAWVISDYPYIDLDTDWDADGDGFLVPEDDTNPEHTREPEIFVGRIHYYGEDSPYAKFEDVSVILDRCIRYDTEADKRWRYNFAFYFDSYPELQALYEEKGINYELVSRHHHNVIGLPAITARNGYKHISNFEMMQDYPISMMSTHSHGGPMGMEGLHSKHIAANADDKYPTIMTLGACDIASVTFVENLVYTLLRFESVAVMGGTGSVTNYGGDWDYVKKHKLGKEDLLFAGKSIGEAHWRWYGGLYRTRGRIPMTGAKINLFGDPSVVPLPYGENPPYPFIAKPVMGHFAVAGNAAELNALQPHEITLSNPTRDAVNIKVNPDQEWLQVSKQGVRLEPGQSAKLHLKVDANKTRFLKPGEYNEAVVYLSSDDGYECRRRYVLKVPMPEIRDVFAFEGNTENAMKLAGGHDYAEMHLPRKADENASFVEGRYGQGSNAQFAVSGHMQAFEKENFSILTWLKVDDAAPNGDKSRLLMSGHEFFGLHRTRSGLRLDIRNYALNDDQVWNESLDINARLETGKWHHIAFGVNQARGKLEFFLDGREVASKTLPQFQIYGGQGIAYSKFNGAVDDLVIATMPINENMVRTVAAGQYAIHPTPADGYVGVSPNGGAFATNFSAVTGAALDGATLYLREKGTTQFDEIQRSENGTWAAPTLKSNQAYEWVLKSEQGRSPVWTFTTGEELLERRDLKRYASDWKGDWAPQGRGQDGLHVKSEVQHRVGPSFAANTVYEFSGHVCRGGYAELFYMDGSEKVVVDSQHFGGPQRRFSTFKSQLVSPPGQHVGKPLYLGIRSTENMEVRDMSLVSKDKGDINFPPRILPSLEGIRAVAHVGQVGFQIVLTEHVVDPEREAMVFEVIDGPDWGYVQGGDTFFSNYGPPADAVGEHVFTISARDKQGSTVEFKLPVKVANRAYSAL